MWYWILRVPLKIFAKVYLRLKVEGLENIPRTNFIIASNHASYLDAPIIMATVPRKIHCISLRMLYKMWWIRWFLKMVEAVPVGSSSQKALNILLENKNVGIFPEGGISHTGKLREFRRGAALLGLKTGRPIVPCAVIGTFEALPVTSMIPKPRPVILKIGKPIYLLKEFNEVIDDSLLQQGTFRLRNSIKELFDGR